jgi:long-chain acyl-CoA synthetase
MSPVKDVSALVTLAAQESPDRLAVVEAEGRSLTWRQLEDEVAAVATGLGGAGVVAGHRVMLALGNRLEFVTAYLGVLRAQAVAVPVNPRATADELQRMVEDSRPRLLVAGQEALAAVRAALGAVGTTGESGPQVHVVGASAGPGEHSFADLVAARARPVPPLPDPEKLAALLYTSGTSGRPRAAMLTHRALLADIEQVAAVEPAMIHGDDVVLGVLPLFHVYGLNAVLGSVLRHRAKLLLVERWDPRTVLDVIEDEAVSVVPVAPPAFAHWLDMDDLAERLGPVRLVLSGSAPLEPAAIEAFTAATGLPVHQGYGLTEAAPVVTSTLGTERPRPVSVGSPLPGVELRLVDDAGDPVAGEDPGEIWVRGANLFAGYWPGGSDGPDAEGWLATGDLAYADEDGDLHLVDRRSDLILVSGFNVYPAEVERVLDSHPAVAESAVIGVPDPRTGAAVRAVVVLRPGAELTFDELRAHAAGALARYKVPTSVHVLGALPHSLTGKVSRARLRELGLSRPDDGTDPAAEDGDD